MNSLPVSPILMKFGGTSVEDAYAFERVARIVRGRRHERPVVVVSAMSRMTDALLSCVGAAAGGRPQEARPSLEEQLARHSRVARELSGGERLRLFLAGLDDARGELEALLHSVAAADGDQAALKDSVVSYGERLSALLLTSVLCERGLPARHFDARRLIITDKEYGRAEPLLEETYDRVRRELLPSVGGGEIPVLGGFIGGHADGTTTTLGRNGSDFTASLVGAALDAREVEIWSDVDGVLSADPHVVARARHIPSLTYGEAEELARFGAKILHPKTIRPAADKLIPIRIRNSRAPESPGTVVCTEADVSEHEFKAVTHKAGVTALRITCGVERGPDELLPAVFKALKNHPTDFALVATSGATVSLVFDGANVPAPLLEELGGVGAVQVTGRRALVCVMGAGHHTFRRVTGQVLHALRDLDNESISQGDSERHLLFLVDERDAHEAVNRLHESLLERETRPAAATCLLSAPAVPGEQ